MWEQGINLVIVRLRDISLSIIEVIPMLIIAGVILFLGWLLAGLATYLTLKMIRAVNLREKISRIKVLQNLSYEEKGMADLFGNLSYWFCIFLTLIIVLEVFGINIGRLIIEKSLKIIPNVVVAALILIFGLLVSLLAEELASILMYNARIKHRAFWSKIIKWITLIFAVIIAMEQLGLVARFVLNILLLIIGAVALGFTLAFGLGCKDIARDIVIEFFKNSNNEPKK